MIALVGIPSEPPMALVIRALERLGAPHFILHQRGFDRWNLELECCGSRLAGRVHDGTRWIPIERIRGIYARLTDLQSLPELKQDPLNTGRRRRCAVLHDLVLHWMEAAEGRVLNRPSAMTSNGSKPYQSQLIARLGFEVPATLITDDPDLVSGFLRQHRRIIYKSISGARSIVTEWTPDDEPRLARIRGCPVQFQALVEGIDVRVHVVGDRAFAVRAETRAIDYRYAGRSGEDLTLTPCDLDPPLAARCVSLARGLGLDFAGIDLKVTPDGRAVCFEVNPCPAFSFYEEHTGQPIADAVASLLASGETSNA